MSPHRPLNLFLLATQFKGSIGANSSRVLDYIEANLEGDLSIERMAAIACLSRFHFARSFRQAVGQSPHRYVSAKRLERAKALLMHGDRPLVDIALALSFSSQANFTTRIQASDGSGTRPISSGTCIAETGIVTD